MTRTMERLIAVRHDKQTLNAAAGVIAEGLRLPFAGDWRAFLAGIGSSAYTSIGDAVEEARQAMPNALPAELRTDDRSALAELIGSVAEQMTRRGPNGEELADASTWALPVAMNRYAVDRVMATPRVRNRKGASAPDVSRAPRRAHEHRARMVLVRSANALIGEQMIGGLDWQPREIAEPQAGEWKGERDAEGNPLDGDGCPVVLPAFPTVEAVSEGWRKRAGIDATTRVRQLADGSLKVTRGVGRDEPMVKVDRYAKALSLGDVWRVDNAAAIHATEALRVRLVERSTTRPPAIREEYRLLIGGGKVDHVEVIKAKRAAREDKRAAVRTSSKSAARDTTRAARAEVLAALDAVTSIGGRTQWAGWTIHRATDRKAKNGRVTPFYVARTIGANAERIEVEGTPRAIATALATA